jgi:hypothetical protein
MFKNSRKGTNVDTVFSGVSAAFFLIILDLFGFHPAAEIAAAVMLLVVAYRIGTTRPKAK